MRAINRHTNKRDMQRDARAALKIVTLAVMMVEGAQGRRAETLNTYINSTRRQQQLHIRYQLE